MQWWRAGRWSWCLLCIMSTSLPSSATATRRGRRFWCMSMFRVAPLKTLSIPHQVLPVHFSLSMHSTCENLLCLLKAWYWSTRAGSLYENVDMTFENRLKIAQGAAEGLLYLHTFANPPIIHRDVKPANLLLAKEYNVSAAYCNIGIVCYRHTRTYTYVSLRFPCHR